MRFFCLGVVRSVCGGCVLGLLCCSCILIHRDCSWVLGSDMDAVVRICVDTQSCVSLQLPKTISVEKCL